MDILDDRPKNDIIVNNLIKAYKIINNQEYEKIVCTVSGGADSDIVLDICTKCDKYKKIEYVWFDTGLEYEATKEHLEFLEEKYGIEIKKEEAIKKIPTCCRTYGQPFLSKKVSEWISRLQRHKFKWEDESFGKLIMRMRYPKYRAALRWWCNDWGEGRKFNITYNKWLKEFMVENHPKFLISPKCCDYAKKDVLHKLINNNDYDLNISGVRKAEGGARSSAYKNCFDEKVGECDNYRPVFWYFDDTKKAYEQHYEVLHSSCYSEYGLKRTGCVGCPFGKEFEFELSVIQKHEPKFYKAVNNIFRESYDYTRKYREYAIYKKNELKNDGNEDDYKQIELDLVI